MPVADGGVGSIERTVTVEVFGVDGDARRQFQVRLGPNVAQAFGPAMVDTREGLAMLTTSVTAETQADGGAAIVTRNQLEFRWQDGGVEALPLGADCVNCDPGPDAHAVPAALYRIGETVVLDEIHFGGLGGTNVQELSAYSPTGIPLAAHLKFDFAGPISLLPGTDALAFFPGPRLISEHLEFISAAPQVPQSESSAADWNIAERQVVTAFLGESNVLMQGFNFSGDVQFGPIKLSEGERIDGVARSAHGVGILFVGSTPNFDSKLKTSWFAFVDEKGVKRGPDVPIEAGQFSGAGLIASAREDDHFKVFTQSPRGLTFSEVVCE